MIDTLEIWCKYNPDFGGPHSASPEWEWKPRPNDRATLEIAGGIVKLFVREEAKDLRDPWKERGQIRATIQVPALLGLKSPNDVWQHYYKLPHILNDIFDTCWWGKHPPFVAWRVARMDASFDFKLPPEIDVQDVIRQLHQVEPPGFVPNLIGKRGSKSALWYTQGRKGRPAENPDVLRVYDKRRQLEDTGAPQELVEAFRGVLRLEYEVKAEHGVMQGLLKRDNDAPVLLHEVFYPLKVYRILQRAAKLLCLEDLRTVRVNAREILRAKFAPRRANTLYQHWLWMLVNGEDDWVRSYSQGSFSTTRRDIRAAGLYPVVAEPLPLRIELPFAPMLAEDHWLKKLRPRRKLRQTRYQ